MDSGISIGYYYQTTPTLDPVVTDWVTRTIAASGTVAASTQTAIDTYVKGCKTDGYWTTLASGVILPFASDAFAGFAVPLVIPSGGTLTNQSFVAADYSLLTGVDPGATNSTKSIVSNIQAQTIFTSTNVQISGYKRSTRTPSTSGALGGTIVSTSSRVMFFEAPAGTSGAILDAFNTSTSQGRVQVSGNVKTPLRYSTAKLLSGRRSILFNGVEQAFNTTTGGTFPSTSLISFFGVAPTYCTNVFSFIYAGAALTDAQDLQHSNRVHALQTALGRGV